jgi:UDP-N-acetylmuramoyl-tripeptide--D-alanyl-D-alanine ligase
MKHFLKLIVVKFLTLESRLALARHKPKIIAVTGSVGKTSTKDAIYTVLSSSFKVRKSDKSQNSEIGVPLTILGLHNAWSSSVGWTTNLLLGLFTALFGPHFPKLLVLEVGADHPHDIETITKWLKPDIAVFTRMSDVPVHVENFPSVEAVFAEKSFLAQALIPHGTLILNSNDSRIISLKDKYKHKKVITFGIGASADVKLTKDTFLYKNSSGKPHPTGFEYSIKTSKGLLTGVINGALGKQHLYPILSAVATGLTWYVYRRY